MKMETESNKRKEEVMVEEKKSVRFSDLCLRFMAFTFSLAAAITLGIDKQTALVPVTLVSTLPPINVPVTAKYNQMSAFTYFVVTNIIACSYGALSLIIILINRGKRNGFLAMTIIIIDLIMVALLASGGGATAAVGLIGYNGNKHAHWNKVCDVFGKFCHQVTGAAIVSLFGSLSFLLLVLLAALDLHKKKY